LLPFFKFVHTLQRVCTHHNVGCGGFRRTAIKGINATSRSPRTFLSLRLCPFGQSHLPRQMEGVFVPSRYNVQPLSVVHTISSTCQGSCRRRRLRGSLGVTLSFTVSSRTFLSLRLCPFGQIHLPRQMEVVFVPFR